MFVFTQNSSFSHVKAFKKLFRIVKDPLKLSIPEDQKLSKVSKTAVRNPANHAAMSMKLWQKCSFYRFSPFTIAHTNKQFKSQEKKRAFNVFARFIELPTARKRMSMNFYNKFSHFPRRFCIIRSEGNFHYRLLHVLFRKQKSFDWSY